MPDFEELKKDVAGRFLQAMRAKTYALHQRLLPLEIAEQVIETAEREVEDKGLQEEGRDVVRLWIRNEADAEWLEKFWQSPEGSRFLDLSVELMARAMYRRFAPNVPIPPPTKT